MEIFDCSMAVNLGGSQSKIYVRPIQKSLSTKSIFLETTSSMKETYKYGNSEILIKDLRKHLWFCCEILSSSEEEGGDVYFENINRNERIYFSL